MPQVKYWLKDFFHNNKYLKNFPDQELQNKRLQNRARECEKEMRANIKRMGGSGNEKLFPPEELKTIYKTSQAYWLQHKTYQNMPLKQLKNLRYILFANPNEGVESGIYNNPHQFNDLKNTVVKKNMRSFLKHLISDLLYEYPKDKNVLFKRLQEAAHSLCENKISNRSMMEANKHFNILKETGPECVARAVLNTDHNLEDILQNLWLKERHLSGGMGQEIIKKMCDLNRRSLSRLSENPHSSLGERARLNRFLEYVSGSTQKKSERAKKQSLKVVSRQSLDNGISETDLEGGRYQDVKPIVKSLLNPFQNTAPPEDSLKQVITQFLDLHVGDPRFKSEKWIAMPREKDIFMQWKIAESIEAFIALLAYVARQNERVDRMWRKRQEVIEAYWRAGYIKNAWVILGDEAHGKRFRFLKEGTRCGLLKGATALRSVLLYQTGDLTVLEGNYDQGLRIFKSSNSRSPLFNQSEYKMIYNNESITEKGIHPLWMKKADKEIRHFSSENYYWQKQLVDYIKKWTGLPCPKGLRKQINKYQ